MVYILVTGSARETHLWDLHPQREPVLQPTSVDSSLGRGWPVSGRGPTRR